MGIIRDLISGVDDETLAAIMRGADDEVLARMFRQLPIAAQLQLACDAELQVPDAREEPEPAKERPTRPVLGIEFVLGKLAPGETISTRALGERCGGDVRAACAALERKGMFVRAGAKGWTYPVQVPEQKIGGNDDYGTPGDD